MSVIARGISNVDPIDYLVSKLWIPVVLATEVTTSSSTFGSITGMVVPLEANGIYDIRGSLIWETRAGSGGSVGINFGFTDPASCKSVLNWKTTGATAVALNGRQATADDTGTAAASSYANDVYISLTFDAKAVNSTTAGNFQLRFANSDNATPLYVCVGSSLEYRRIA